jgi:hypothetical protein
LIHEATSVFRLVESIDRFVAEHENLFSYTEATQRFFSGIHGRAVSARQTVLGVIAGRAGSGEQAVPRSRGELITLRDRWRLLHTYVKPAADAHTLSLPVPLLRMATDDLHHVAGLEGTEIVVLLTPELMYYQNTLRSEPPPHSVFVEVPYSQGPGFFANLTIYHEIGHYVFDRLADGTCQSPAFSSLVTRMDRAFAGMFEGKLKKPSLPTWAKGVLDAWTRELFCDLFAVRNLGPAFSFALIDVLSLIGLMEEGTEVRFDKEHPAVALRFREQLRRLRQDGWWASVRQLRSDHITLIRRLANRRRSAYVFEFKDHSIPRFTDCFLSIVPSIHEVVTEVTGHCVGKPEDFRRRKAEIERCFLHGCVPSMLLSETQTESPTPAAIVNAAYCFQLASLGRLMGRFVGQVPHDMQHRAKWIEKLEAWAMKGIEDSQLLSDKREYGRQHGR